MNIGQIVLPAASFYERKSQVIDSRCLNGSHQVTELAHASWDDSLTRSFDLIHVYGNAVPATSLTLPSDLPLTWTADVPPSRNQPPPRTSRRTFFGRQRPIPPIVEIHPALVRAFRTSPVGDDPLPEAVEEQYFTAASKSVRERSALQPRVIGTVARGKGVQQQCELTFARLMRFRDDIEWRIFDHFPDVREILETDVWVDPAVRENDLDGLTAEALVLGKPVVASRTAMNIKRLANGKFGSLVPVRDPNELAHAILNTLFKPEEGLNKSGSSDEVRWTFSPENRCMKLLEVYERALS